MWKRLLKHEFYDLTLHMWRREPNQEFARDALRWHFNQSWSTNLDGKTILKIDSNFKTNIWKNFNLKDENENNPKYLKGWIFNLV